MTLDTHVRVTRGYYYRTTYAPLHSGTIASPAFLSSVPHATRPIRFVNDKRTSGRSVHFMNEPQQPTTVNQPQTLQKLVIHTRCKVQATKFTTRCHIQLRKYTDRRENR